MKFILKENTIRCSSYTLIDTWQLGYGAIGNSDESNRQKISSTEPSPPLAAP